MSFHIVLCVPLRMRTSHGFKSENRTDWNNDEKQNFIEWYAFDHDHGCDGLRIEGPMKMTNRIDVPENENEDDRQNGHN